MRQDSADKNHCKSDVSQAVLSLASAALFNKPVDIPEGIDWHMLLNEIKYHQIISLTYPVVERLKPQGVPNDVSDKWQSLRDIHLINSVKNMSAHFSIHKILSENDIPYVILKGLASGSYYPDFMKRAYGDVDFLVKKSDFRRASSLLKSEGFRLIFEHDKHRGYIKNGITHELHNDIVGVPYAATKKVFDEFFSDITEKAAQFRHGNLLCMIPSDMHHAVIILLHKTVHLRNDGIGLRHLCDWASFVGVMSDDFFEEEMKSILEKMGIWHFAVIMTDLCTEYLGLRKCSWAGTTDSAYLYKMMTDILSSGDFGVKKASAETTARRHAARRVSYGEKGFTRVFLHMLSDSAKAAFPIAEKHPVLLPIACAYAGVRHIVRLATGRRTISGTGKLLKDSSEQRAIFDEWRLFEPDS